MTLDLISAPDPEPEAQPEPELVPVVLYCRTDGCVNAGVPIHMELSPDTSYAFCGPCGERITDYVIEELPEEE